MIDVVTRFFLLAYACIALLAVRRATGVSARIVVAMVFLLPTIPWIYAQAVFRYQCRALVAESVVRSASSVDGITFSSNWGVQPQWVRWLVAKGGYAYVDYQLGADIERVYWGGWGLGLRRASVPESTARYEVMRLVTWLPGNIQRNDFVARDRTTGEELGRKTVLHMPFGALVRFIHRALPVGRGVDGHFCPGIGTPEQLLSFFPSQVLVPERRSRVREVDPP